MIEKSQYFIIEIDGSEGKLDLADFIELLQSNIFNFIHIFLAFKLLLDLHLFFFSVNIQILKKYHDLILFLLLFWMFF